MKNLNNFTTAFAFGRHLLQSTRIMPTSVPENLKPYRFVGRERALVLPLDEYLDIYEPALLLNNRCSIYNWFMALLGLISSALIMQVSVRWLTLHK